MSASGSIIPCYLLPLDSMASPGSDDGASASASTAAVCCMCGDRGLPHELFRCNLCGFRLQHRYCSDLYPRPYRSCNWCLIKDNGGGGGGGSPVKVKAPAPAGARRRSNRDDDDDDDGDQEEERASGGGCTRSAFSPDPEKPVKKKPEPKKSRDDGAVRRPVVKTAAKKRREAPPATAGGKVRFKVKVRRYKLLAEVISAS
ncbi:unnamed protein product [Urochloa decumbens]|uniref:PHD-type zinc finger plants domain-containing protein n=1 Tax=Urochloa decumbens TaxID=240449 RepID=A0ABC8ZZT5_9POAL